MAFNRGDIVALKSGGPSMTVWDITSATPDQPLIYSTAWFHGGDLHRDKFGEAEIRWAGGPPGGGPAKK